MFSGLVESVGRVEHCEATPAGLELGVQCPFEDIRHGESIAINGVCLTVRDCGRGWFSVAAGQQTLARTTIGDWHAGTAVNLERALRVGDRLGGHIVQGHVDCVGAVVGTRDKGDVLLARIAIPLELAELFVTLGSVAVDGVSLTVNALPQPDVFEIAVIDYTRRHTTLGRLREGSLVHVEADVIAKHVHRLFMAYLDVRTAPSDAGSDVSGARPHRSAGR